MTKQVKNRSQGAVDQVGMPIFAALTQQEIADLLDILFATLPPDLHQQVLEQIPDDTRQTLEHILSSPIAEEETKETAERPVSLAKLAETWSALWNQWYDIVIEAAQEEGDYIVQEEHWEAPYFDEYGLVEDLEKVATKMLPLVETAYVNRFDPDMGFGAAIADAETEISSGLPDWIEIVNGLGLQRNLTLCFLTWERLLADEEGKDAYGFIERVRQWEKEFEYSNLDRDSVVDFMSELSEADERCILQGLTADKDDVLWKASLSSTYSHWNGIYMYYLDRYAPERYLENLRADIPQQWQAGLPLLEDLLQRREFGESTVVATEMVDSMLRSRTHSKTWNPETGLLFDLVHGYHESGANWKQHKGLLRAYQQAAQGLKQTELANALSIQLAAFDHSFDWNQMLALLTETPLDAATQDALFQSWRNLIARGARPYVYNFGYEYGLETKKDSDIWWVHWLLDSHYDPSRGVTWFQQQMNEWLATLTTKQAVLDQDHGQLRLLTADLAAIGQVEADSFPRFFQFIIRPRELLTKDDRSRQAYLSQSVAADLGINVMVYWRQHLRDLTPDPSSAQKSNYTAHARWMAALQEINANVYHALLSEWQVDHQRRRNLWKAMDELNLR